MLEPPRNDQSAPCTSKIVRRTFLLCNSNAVSSGTAVLPASSSVRPSSKPGFLFNEVMQLCLRPLAFLFLSLAAWTFLISLRYLSLHGISMDTVRSLFKIYSFLFINYFMALEKS